MARTIDYFVRRIREELRAEGADGQGYSDFFVVSAINSAIQSLTEVYTIRDCISFTTEEDVREYNLKNLAENVEIVTILFVTHGSKTLASIPLNSYLSANAPTEGPIDRYIIWGDKLILTGVIPEGEVISVWVMRTPRHLVGLNDEPEIPSYMDDAIIYSSIAACYRESRDYERAAYYQELYNRERSILVRRQIPQTQRSHSTGVREVYSSPMGQYGRTRATDTNPSGGVD